MKKIIASGILTAFCFGVWSCGASENTRDDILKLGGISSTGNKEDEPASNEGVPHTGTGEEPVPNQALICEHSIDLSGRSYQSSAVSGSGVVCSGSERSGVCMSVLTFTSKKDVTIAYLTDNESGQTTELATYNMCGTTLGVHTSETNAKGEYSTELLKADADLTTLIDEESGLVFNLIK